MCKCEKIRPHNVFKTSRCVSRWLEFHPELLDSPKFLYYLFEVLELGISGRKSRNKNGLDTPKHEKVNEPVSGRVRHAAEEVLHLLFQQRQKDSLVDESLLANVSKKMKHILITFQDEIFGLFF